MHDTALELGGEFFNIYCAEPNPSILDVGAMNVNGSLRTVAPPGCRYVGVDMAPGEGVDIVVQDADALPFADDSFDAVVSTSCLEHDSLFWLTFLEMVRVTRPAGHIYLNVPSNGDVHRYPIDSWRFFPDAGISLEKWAVKSGMPVILMESFVACRKRFVYNDFVAVFRKGAAAVAPGVTIMSKYRLVTNGRVHGRAEILNRTTITEDMALLRQAQGILRQSGGSKPKR